MEERKQITVKLEMRDSQALLKLSQANNITLAEQARRYIKKGMSVDLYANDEAKIIENMKTALEQVLDPHIDRIVKITVKNAIASSINLLYTAMLLYRICAPASRPKLDIFMEDARKMGIRFVQLSKGSIDEFLKSSMATLNDMWENDNKRV